MLRVNIVHFIVFVSFNTSLTMCHIFVSAYYHVYSSFIILEHLPMSCAILFHLSYSQREINSLDIFSVFFFVYLEIQKTAMCLCYILYL